MPSSNYGSDEKVRTWAEHFLPPVLTYLVRKVNLAVVLALLFMARQVSKPYGFDFSASVSDRDSWKWEPHKYVPVYRAHVEKVE